MRIICGLLLAIVLLGIGKLCADEAPAPDPAQAQLNGWLDELDADAFSQREFATQQLIDAGPAAIERLTEHLTDASLEAATRGVHVLRELALSPDAATEAQSRAALETLAANPHPQTASRAKAALSQLDELRRERAVRHLEQLGAVIARESLVIAEGEPMIASVTLGAGWKGAAADLQRLAWLGPVYEILFDGPQFDDASVAAAGAVPGLKSLSIKRAAISDKALAAAASLKSLNQLTVMYSPITDASAEQIEQLPALVLIKLYGTKITKERADALAQKLPTAEVDFRHGAFLGVGCQPHPDGCQVILIQANSAAEQAGLETSDVIIEYNGDPTPDFAKLTELIARNAPGESASMKIIRGAERLEKTIKLGQWE